jgi:hypothetical protein
VPLNPAPACGLAERLATICNDHDAQGWELEASFEDRDRTGQRHGQLLLFRRSRAAAVFARALP